MLKNVLFVILLMISNLFTAYAEGHVSDVRKKDDIKEVRFSLNMGGGLTMFPARSSVPLDGMKWKILCFDDQYSYLFDRIGSIGDAANEIRVSVAKGIVYRFLFLCTTTNESPELTSDGTCWDLDTCVPQLPLADPMAMLVSRGSEKDGTFRIAAASTSVQVTFAPHASKIVLQKDSQTASDITVNSVTFVDAASSVPYAHIEPQCYSKYENLSVIIRKTCQYIPQEDVCCMLLDMCARTFGVNATLHITHPISGGQNMRVTVPVRLALSIGSGKTYYIEMSANVNGKVVATWTTRVAPKALKLATQSLWGKDTSVVLDYFDKIDVDVFCAQECNKLSEPDVQAQGLYVHTHPNNRRGKCSIMSRYLSSGITLDKYGVYTDLDKGIIVLVMNYYSVFYPYGPYQLNGIEYKRYETTDDIGYVVKVNKEARQGTMDKLLEDFNSSTTPFVCLSGDSNESSWLGQAEGALSAGLASHVVQWPTIRSPWEGDIKDDAYRTIHPGPVTHPEFTWTLRPSEGDTKDRLDPTLYALSLNADVKSCQVIGGSTETSDTVLPSWGPSEEVFDYRGLRTEFVFTKRQNDVSELVVSRLLIIEVSGTSTCRVGYQYPRIRL